MKRYVKSAKSQKDIDRLHRWGFTDEEINKFSDAEVAEMIKSADEPLLPPDLEDQIYSEFPTRDADDICALIENGYSVDAAIQAILED